MCGVRVCVGVCVCERGRERENINNACMSEQLTNKQTDRLKKKQR